jgi:hypothetical protein
LMQAAAANNQAAPINGSPVTNVQTAALITQSAMAKTPTNLLTTVAPPLFSAHLLYDRPHGHFTRALR